MLDKAATPDATLPLPQACHSRCSTSRGKGIFAFEYLNRGTIAKRLDDGRKATERRSWQRPIAHLAAHQVRGVNVDRPRWSVRGLPPFLGNRPPTRSTRLARKSRRLCLQALSSPWRAGDIRLQSACRDVPQDNAFGLRQQSGPVEQVRLVSRSGPLAGYVHSGAQPSTNACSGCSLLNEPRANGRNEHLQQPESRQSCGPGSCPDVASGRWTATWWRPSCCLAGSTRRGAGAAQRTCGPEGRFDNGLLPLLPARRAVQCTG